MSRETNLFIHHKINYLHLSVTPCHSGYYGWSKKKKKKPTPLQYLHNIMVKRQLQPNDSFPSRPHCVEWFTPSSCSVILPAHSPSMCLQLKQWEHGNKSFELNEEKPVRWMFKHARCIESKLILDKDECCCYTESRGSGSMNVNGQKFQTNSLQRAKTTWNENQFENMHDRCYRHTVPQQSDNRIAGGGKRKGRGQT